MDGKVFFSAYSEPDEELWVSDGSPGGSRVITDGRGLPEADFHDLQVVQDRLLFTLCPGPRELWQSTGSAETTAPLISADGWDLCHERWRFTAAGHSLFFWQEGGFDTMELWATDLTGNGLRKLATIEDSFDPAPSIEFQGQLFSLVTVSGLDITHHELWQSDGSEQGTRKVVDVPSPQPPTGLTVVDGLLYFGMTDPLGDYADVWRTDGTAAGTLRLNAEQMEVFKESGFVKLGPWVYFLARQNGAGLWRTDGTAAGTVLVRGLPHFEDEPSDLVVYAGALYFFAPTLPVQPGQHSRVALWRSDGTTAGTLPVREIGPFFDFINEQFRATLFGDKLFFVANDSILGHELWQSDGTAQGTRIVKDIYPGAASSSPSSLRVAGGRLYFAANDPVHGIELWQSDGTEAGTKLVQDIKPEAASSSPEQLIVAGNRLFFTADDGFTGRELWTLPLDAPAGCQPSPTSLCLSNGRFKVEALWYDFEGRSGRGTAVPLTADTGYFWFFGPDNVEVMVKVLDGRGLNDHHWVFYGALSNVEFALTVTDIQTGASRRYLNPLGQFASGGDTEGFGRLGAFSSKRADHVAGAAPPPVVTESLVPAAKEACQPAPQRLCLGGGRFAVEARWKDFQGQTGSGTGAGLTGDTGYFWFFSSANVEVVVKVLDGTALNGKHWVFFGALSNVEYTLTVTDTATGKVKTYTNPSGRFASFGDTDAF